MELRGTDLKSIEKIIPRLEKINQDPKMDDFRFNPKMTGKVNIGSF